MTDEGSFLENVLKAFKNIGKEIEKDSSEHDIRYRFVKYFMERVLGYEPKYIKWEKKRADLTIIDENDFAVIKIETKRPTDDIDKTQYEEQAFKYEEETTRFIGLTNFLRFRLWEVRGRERELRINLDFSKILEQRKPTHNLSNEQKSQILFLNNLTKETLFDPSKYEKFDETYARIDITKDTGFNKLLDRLNFIANTLVLGYILKTFGEYKEGYSKYQAELSKVEKASKNNIGNRELNRGIAKYKQELEEKYEKYKTFSGYYLWKEYSLKEDVPDDEVKEIFCKETIYVFLNKLLFLRICEDKGFLEKNISNGGIEELRTVLKKRFKKDTLNKEILKLAFESAKGLYSHFYETGILDWFRTGDRELNELLNRVLWILNQFNFTNVDRDILGNLYEKYLPGKERKRLGEFYTPTEVIDYILTSVGYTYSYDIETKELLDPACGSGGFLVRATRRLMSKYLMKFGKTDKRELRDPMNWKEIVSRLSSDEAKIILEAIQEHIYGLDINPFACHIAEMNLLFQIIDLYQKVADKHPDYKLKRFKIYRTDSLKKPAQKEIWDYSYSAFLEEQEEINAIKNKKFDFVVGNPPYIRVQFIDERAKKYYKQNYHSATGKFDIFVLFIESGLNWLKPSGKLGFITSNRYIQANYGKRIRKYILDNSRILTYIDFGDSGVFKDVTNYPSILILDKNINVKSRAKIIQVLKDKEKILLHIWNNFKQKEYSDNFIKIFGVNQDNLSENVWQFVPEESRILVEKLEASGVQFNKIYDVASDGVQTSANNVYVITEDTVEENRLEKGLIKPVISGENIKRWFIIKPQKYLIYPHEKEGKAIDETILKNDYSNIYQYLKHFKHQLERRTYLIKAKRKWYEHWCPRKPEWFENLKILTPDISTTSKFSFDETKVFGTNTLFVILLKKEYQYLRKYILGLLNSQLLEFYFKSISPFLSGGYYRYIPQYFGNLPIKLPETAEEKKIANQIIRKVDEILELYKSGIVDMHTILEGKETEKLHQLQKVTFNIGDNTKFEKIRTEGNKIYINSQDFIKVNKKKIRDFVEVFLNSISERLCKAKDFKNMILDISVPKSDSVLKEIIKKGELDQSQIKEKVKKMELVINEFVYQLYGITKKERKIIEAVN